MNYQEINRIGVVKLAETKRITQKEAASLLNICTRQMRRIQLRYRCKGIEGLVSRHYGKPSNNCFDSDFKLEISQLIKDKYADLGPTLVHKKITGLHNKIISEESVRKIMIEYGIWTPKQLDTDENHQFQARTVNAGKLIEDNRKLYDWF